MAKVKAPPCYECQKKPAKLKHSPFCSVACAAYFGRMVAGDKSYCAKCDDWSNWDYSGGSHEHDTTDESEGRWRVTKGWPE